MKRYRKGTSSDAFIIRVLAEMPLVAADLKDPEDILSRIEEMASGQMFDEKG